MINLILFKISFLGACLFCFVILKIRSVVSAKHIFGLQQAAEDFDANVHSLLAIKDLRDYPAVVDDVVYLINLVNDPDAPQDLANALSTRKIKAELDVKEFLPGEEDLREAHDALNCRPDIKGYYYGALKAAIAVLGNRDVRWGKHIRKHFPGLSRETRFMALWKFLHRLKQDLPVRMLDGFPDTHERQAAAKAA